MKRKLMKQNKSKLTRLCRLANRNGMYLTDLMALKRSLSTNKADMRMVNKHSAYSYYDVPNAHCFPGGRMVFVPIIYVDKYGRKYQSTSKRMIKEEEFKKVYEEYVFERMLL